MALNPLLIDASKLTDLARASAISPSALFLVSQNGQSLAASTAVLQSAFAPSVTIIFNTVAELIATSVPGTVLAVQVLGYYAAGDGGGAVYVVSEGPAAPGKIQTVNGQWFSVSPSQRLNFRQFGAKTDRVTDDTPAVQAGVDFCAANDWPNIYADGSALLTAKINIDRDVTTPKPWWYIIGGSEMGGFYAKTAFTLFDTSLPSPTGIPVSDQVTFQNVLFEVDDKTRATYVMSKRLLRIQFVGCFFEKIKAANITLGGDANGYAQDISFIGCNAFRWLGPFFKARVMFDVVSIESLYEFGGSGFDASEGQVFGVSITTSAMEGSFGPFVTIGGGSSLTIQGNYTEDNAAADYILTDVDGSGELRGLVFQGNFMQTRTPSQYNVVLGLVSGVTVGGNYCSGNLYDDTATVAGSFKCSDAVDSGAILNKSGRAVTLYAGAYPMNVFVTAHAGGGRPSASPLIYGVNPLNTVTAADSAVLPAAKKGQLVTVINSGATAQIFGAGSDTVNGIAGATGIAQAIGQVTYYCYTDGSWVA